MSTILERSMEQWISHLWPVLVSITAQSAGTLLSSVLFIAQDYNDGLTCADAVRFIELYSQRMKGSMHYTFGLVLSLVRAGSEFPRNPPLTPRKRKRRSDMQVPCILDPGILMCELTLRWTPETTSMFLRAMIHHTGWEAVETLIAKMHAHSRFEKISLVLQQLSVSSAALAIRKITAVFQLGPSAVAAYVRSMAALELATFLRP